MKKHLLCFSLILLAIASNAQGVLLNEVYVRPSAGNQEYLELHNTDLTTPHNLDCYSVVTYFKNATQQGFYVLDLPNYNLGGGGYFVASSQKTFTYQNTSFTANYDWNSVMAGASTTKYVLNSAGTGYTAVTGTYDDIFLKSSNTDNGNNGIYAVFLFDSGNIIDVLLASHNSLTIPNYITDLPNLPAGALPCSTTPVNFSTLDDNASIVGNVNPAAGTDNGYYRENNNRCGPWLKSAAVADQTPGRANRGTIGQMLDFTAQYVCGSTTFTYDITGAASAFIPVTATLYYDVNGNNAVDATDVIVGTHVDAAISDPSYTFNVAAGSSLLLVLDAAGNCADMVIPYNCEAGGPLPVRLTAFNAAKNSTGVLLTWTTASEANSKGFEILKKTENGFEPIAFIDSKAAGGYSTSALTYEFTDQARSTKGVTFYRLRQVDADNRYSFSDIRAVRTDGISGAFIFPNPSNGNANVVLPSGAGRMDISLVDLSGRVIRSWSNVRDANLQMNNLRSGMYAVKILFAETGVQVTEKLVVQ